MSYTLYPVIQKELQSDDYKVTINGKDVTLDTLGFRHSPLTAVGRDISDRSSKASRCSFSLLQPTSRSALRSRQRNRSKK